ncbi:hypothetical protein Chor_011635 [Crotalus horridus]
MEKSLEGSGKVPRIVQVMYFKGMPRQMNQQPDVGLPQQWEAQWQEFLNTLQPPAHAGWGNLQLTDTVPWDDTCAFLAAFEQVAEACQWPREEWVRQLLPALRGGMEQSFCRLDPRDRGDYMKPIRVKEELGLDEKPIHWEVMQERGSSSSALGLLVPTPELISQADQPQATFQERPEHRDPIPDTLFGRRIIGEIRIETFQQAISEAEDDFGTLHGEESSGTVPLNPESSPLDPEKQLGARKPEEETWQSVKANIDRVLQLNDNVELAESITFSF